jgi:hypothetical protein
MPKDEVAFGEGMAVSVVRAPPPLADEILLGESVAIEVTQGAPKWELEADEP